MQRELDDEWGDWVTRAHLGQPTGSSPPVTTPPCRLADKFNVDLCTPDAAVPEPMKKTQVAAAKRLQKELAEKAKKEEKPVPKNAKKPQKKTKTAKKTPQAKKQKKSKDPKSSGPLSLAFKEFVAQKKSEGYSYRESQSLWKESAERMEIVVKMSESERKRRRY